MKHIVTAAAIVTGLWAFAASAAEQTARIAVSELSCPSCVYIASTAMREVPTVKVDDFIQRAHSWSPMTTNPPHPR